jgi:peptide/nickel transport system ATP-binding protein
MVNNQNEKIIELRKLKKFFPLKKTSIFDRVQLNVKAVEDISLSIYKGETLGLVGESGCGKSTLGRTILQIYPPTSGSVTFHSDETKMLNLSYILTEINKLSKYQKSAIRYYENSLVFDKKVEEINKKIEDIEKDSNNLDKSYHALKKSLIMHQNKSKEFKKEASRQLREASRLIGSLILQKNIDEIKNLLLKAIQLQGNNNILFEGLAGNFDNLKPEVKSIFEKLHAFKKHEVLHITERVAEEKYIKQLDDNRENFVNLSRLDPEELRSLRRKIQIIFQDPYSSLDSRMTVGQIIGEAVVEHGMFKKDSKELEAYILDIMSKCGLDAYMMHRYPHQFSGGQRQRIGIARALALQPEFIVCDEAVSALDVSIQSQIINLLMELKEKNNLTYLFISHDLSVIKHISDRIGVMYLGNMVELGPADEIYSNPLHPYTKTLLSAIPTTDEVKADRIILEGDIPSNIFPPSGCKFRTRCPLATEKCANVVPEYKEITNGHFVACHYYEKTKDLK